MKYSWKGHKVRNRYKNRIKKRSGQAQLVYVKGISHNSTVAYIQTLIHTLIHTHACIHTHTHTQSMLSPATLVPNVYSFAKWQLPYGSTVVVHTVWHSTVRWVKVWQAEVWTSGGVVITTWLRNVLYLIGVTVPKHSVTSNPRKRMALNMCHSPKTRNGRSTTPKKVQWYQQ